MRPGKRIACSGILICLVIAIAFPIADAADWPTYRHDGARSGVTSEQLAPPLSQEWVFISKDAPEPAWPKPAEELPRMHFDDAYYVAVAGKSVYFGSSMDNKVYSLDAATGKVRWTTFTEGPIRLAPTVCQDRVFVGSDDGYVYCLKAKNGKVDWKYRASPNDEKVLGNGRMISLWPVRTGVLVDGGTAYFGAGVFPGESIYICALRAKDGKVIWKNDTIGDYGHEQQYGGISPQGYLLASESKLYIPSGRALPAAFDRKDGRFLFYPYAGHTGGTWALLTDGELIAGVDDTGEPVKASYDKEKGRRKDDVYAWFPGLRIVVTPDFSYILTENDIRAIDRNAYPVLKGKMESLEEEREKLSGTLSDVRRKLASMNRESEDGEGSEEYEVSRKALQKQIDELTQKINALAEQERSVKDSVSRWEYPCEDFSSLILAGDILFSGGQDEVIAIDTKTGERLWGSRVEGKACGLAVSNGRLFVSTDKGRIYCFGKKEVSKAREIRPALKSSPYKRDKLTPIYETAAEEILRETGVKKGYCLVLGSGEGRLAFELARLTDLMVIGIEPDAKKVKRAREKLDSGGLYGSRVIIDQGSLSDLPYPDYFANLIVSDNLLISGEVQGSSAEMFRVLRPHGGVAYLGQPSGARKAKDSVDMVEVRNWLEDQGLPSPEVKREDGVWAKVTRGPLEGSGGWTHQYADPANTACSDDELVKCPLDVLWFGRPGPEKMVERHARAAAPVSIDGRLFVQGENVVMAYDAYNGTLLWEREIPGAVRVRVDADGGNLAVSKDGFFVAAREGCFHLNPATGETLHTYNVPESPDGEPRRWGYIACVGKTLFGSAADPLQLEYDAFWKMMARDDGTWKSMEEIPEEYKRAYEYFIPRYPEPDERARTGFQRSGLKWRSVADFPGWGSVSSPKGAVTERMMVSDAVFAMDIETGKLKWLHRGNRIAHITISIGDGMVFLAERSVTGEQKEQAFKEKRRLIEKGIFEDDGLDVGPEDSDVRLVVALDSSTGKKLWEKAVDLTGCGGDRLGSAYHDGMVFLFGCFSNHDGDLFGEGALKWRRITALSARNGDTIWSRPLNYLRRPLIVGDDIIIEPRACSAHTGEVKMRTHPVTGEQVPWEFLRPGHCCSITSAAPYGLFYRSYWTMFYDLEEDSGLIHFGAIRPGCWINLVPANGLLLFPEASSGCTCSFPLRSTVAFKPKSPEKSKDWSVFITHGPMTPVKHLAINLGAPGDMKDDGKSLWFGYPRPRVGYGVKFDLSEDILPGMGYFCRDYKGMHIEGTDKPWLFASGCYGATRFDLPLVGDIWGDEPGVYTVRLGFSAPEGDRVGERVFDIKLQDKIALSNFDVLREAGAPNRAVVKEFSGIDVESTLKIELVPEASDPTNERAPLINSIEVIREDVPGEAEEAAEQAERPDAKVLLDMAEAKVSQKRYDEALEMYHRALDLADSDDLKLQALKGLAVIGSPKSMKKIERYCRDVSPILLEYKGLDPEVTDGAIRVYAAVADNIAEGGDKQRAIRMLSGILTAPGSLDTRRQIIDSLEGLGVEVGADAAKSGFITHWHLIGPFPWDGRINNLDKVFVGEPDIDLGKIYQVEDRTLEWKRYVGDRGMINLRGLFDPHDNTAAYAYAEINLPKEQDLLLNVGSDDGFKCWFNGKEVGKSERRTWETLQIKGKKGINTVLLKISQGGGGWGFRVVLTDLGENPVDLTGLSRR